MSDSENDTYFAVRIGTFHDSHIPPLAHDRLKPKIISLYDDFESERASRNSLEEGTSLFGSFKALLYDDLKSIVQRS